MNTNKNVKKIKTFGPILAPLPKVSIEDKGEEFRRYAYGFLQPYGEEQVRLYGIKENLIKRIECHYKIELSKKIRVLCGDILIFFPPKISLSSAIITAEWEVCSGGRGLCCDLIYLQLCNLALSRFDRRIWGTRRTEPENNPLYVYQHGVLYYAYSYPDGDFQLQRVEQKQE